MIDLDSEKIHEKCGVLGVFLDKNEKSNALAETCYYGLLALQHRGKEASGIAVCNEGKFKTYKGLGTVSSVFNKEILSTLTGNVGVGHVLYSNKTVEAKDVEPFVSTSVFGDVAVSHNGALTNYSELRKNLLESGESFVSESEAEVVAKLIVKHSKNRFEKALTEAVQMLQGSFALVVAKEDALIGARDTRGIRPLVLGKLKNGWVLASETSSLDAIDAEFVRDVNPGEIVIITEDGVLSFEFGDNKVKQTCLFEYVYFARPDSVIDGISVQEARLRLGATLAKEAGVEADVVIGVPDSGLGAAMGYANATGIPFAFGIVKNRHLNNNTISPKEKSSYFIKLNVVKSDIEEKRVVIVDDTFPSLQTAKHLVSLLKKAGAKEIHYRVASPMIKSLCNFGIDIPAGKQEISENYSEEALAKEIGASSIGFVSVEGILGSLEDIIPENFGYCTNCFRHFE